MLPAILAADIIITSSSILLVGGALLLGDDKNNYLMYLGSTNTRGSSITEGVRRVICVFIGVVCTV